MGQLSRFGRTAVTLGITALILTGFFQQRGLAQSPVTVRVATIGGDIGAEIYYAKELGLFERAGLDVQIDPTTNMVAIVPAVASGQIDIAYNAVLTLALARAKGLPFSILAPANVYVASAPTAGFVAVTKSSPIQSARDLNGKAIAVNGLGGFP